MKDFFIGWIIWQLVFIGYVGGVLVNQMNDETYDCHAKAPKINPLLTATMPLVFFMPDFSENYCKNKQI